jgi:hypothetical protein
LHSLKQAHKLIPIPLFFEFYIFSIIERACF